METRLLIGGEQAAGGGAALAVENPATEETLAQVPAAAPEDVDAAIAAASEAAPRWASIPAVERADLLHEVAARMRARTDELARVMTLEGGKPLVENSDEVGWTAAAFDYYAEMGRNFAGRVIPSIESTQLALVVKEPIGVWGCIVPWNYPLLLLGWKLAPALAAGNSVVAKPSELTPLSTLMLASCFDHLPPGAFNVVAGAGDVGEAIVRDPRVAGVAFTGSVATGKRVAMLCAERVARMNLEMGGKDPFIVCADVAGDVGVAARGGAWAAYLNAGQVCTSAERFYVAREVYDEFVEAFVEEARGLRVGDPMVDDTDVGPMVSAGQRAKVEAQVESAVAAGAELLVGGGRAGQERGHFYAPAVVTGAPAETDLLREETFGPVAPIVPVDSLDEAIALANGTPYGLGANVYTRDLETAVRCLREIKAGTVWINDPLTDNDAGPFGGMKQSGLGRELGQEGLEAFQDTKHVHIETKIAPKEWWYPYGGGGPPHGASGEGVPLGGARQRQGEGGALVELNLAAPSRVHLEVGEYLECPLQRLTVGLAGAGHGPLGQPGRHAERAGHLLLRHARLDQRGRAVDLAKPSHDRVDESSRPLAVGLELLREREACAQVPRHQRVGQVVGLRCAVSGGELLHVAHPRGGRRMERDRELLQLARQPLLAGADPGDELLGRVRVEPQPQLQRPLDGPLGQLPCLGGGTVAHLSAGLLDRRAQRLQRLSPHDQDQDGVRRKVGQGGLQRHRDRRPSSTPRRPPGGSAPPGRR